MTFTYDDDKPSLEELSHFGVKGMRWGTRKDPGSASPLIADRGKLNRRPTTAEIHGARKAQKDLKEHITTLDNKYGKIPGTKFYKLSREHEAAYEKLLDSDNTVIAAYRTRGEKVAATILLGPVGLIATSNTRGRVQSRLSNQRY